MKRIGILSHTKAPPRDFKEWLELPLARLHKTVLEWCKAAGGEDLDTCAVIREIHRMGKSGG